MITFFPNLFNKGLNGMLVIIAGFWNNEPQDISGGGSMTNRKFFLAAFILVLFIGCASKPLTKSVINDIGFEDINRFQYYTSAGIELTATERIKEPNIDKKGKARIKESSYRDRIIIGKKTMGVLMDSRIDEDGVLFLEICFEEKAADSDKKITFKQDGQGLDRHFYIVYTDPRRRLLKYGDREYTLDTRSGERVYLMIKISKKEMEQDRIRRVKGRKVEN
ncbi:MAG: hypothetical protein FWG27_05170 [Treponema sp.]|jgi:hypothetical protein|nr:hypothetical protein [Treponema sp.]